MIGIYARKTHQGKRFRVNRKEFYQDLLARDLGAPVYTPDMNIPRGTKLVNWGCSATAKGMPVVEWLGNDLNGVACLSHKLRMFRMLEEAEVPCLDWTTDYAQAAHWLNDRHIVYERATLQGHSGKGIRRVKPGQALKEVPLYTKAIEGKFREYRIHVFDGEVICVQQKKRMSPATMQAKGFNVDEETRSAVRTYRNGWVFCVNNITPLDDEAKRIAVDAIKACGAKSGATDILVQDGNAIVIETNSAPALRSPTVREAYVNAILKAGGQANV